ncbi:MAG TPA: T9SS type A sorting domain-containing protein [Candidatus Kapabacteria bacterium]|nr:T9SS type A sorting domain-containing protein [Candidatus Kapabacteria bacterium]HPO62922.1 T9SS type A sorting domain-containing protein [Candidatus Kapabacteria bacterium]
MKIIIWLLGIATLLLSASYVCISEQDDEVVWELILNKYLPIRAYHPNGTKIYISIDKTIQERNAENGDLLRTFKIEDNIGYVDIEVSKDGKYLVASDISSIHIWEIETGEFYKEFKLKEDDIAGYILFSDISLSPDGKQLAGIGQAVTYNAENNMHLVIFNFESGEILFHYFEPLNGMVFNKIQFSNNSNIFTTSTTYPRYEVQFWESELYKISNTIFIPGNNDLSNKVNVLKFSPNDSMLAISYDNKFEIYELPNLSTIMNLEMIKPGGAGGIDFSKNNDKIILRTINDDIGKTDIYNLKTKGIEYTYNSLFYQPIVSPNNQYLFAEIPFGIAVFKTKWDISYKQDEKITNKLIEIFPNPVTDNINLKFDNKIPGYINIYLIDLEGKKIVDIFNKYCIEKHLDITFSTENISSCQYIISIQKDQEEIFTEKIIISK